ncbi:MAG TPA: OPT/YSL family transporter [Kofleriaceae bacterium]|nr:OPT/YSL family transporter [Kofleriaceae bacterium]
MSSEPGESLPGVVPKPPGTREFTIRAVIAGVVVAAIMGASYPYVVLKLGFGPNVSVVAAFFGYLFLGILFRNFNRWENNIVQTAGTSASQTAFMCVILAAFDLLSQNEKLNYHFAPTAFESFLWLTAASILGILLAVPLRTHYVVEEKLTFADGVAAAETIVVLDARGKEARTAALALFLATIVSAFLWLLTTKWSGEIFGVSVIHEGKRVFEPLLPEVVGATMFGLTNASAGAGFSISALSIGSGMIVGNRINLSMAAGAVIAWIIGPKFLVPDVIACAPGADCPTRGELLKWMMWPGTGMLIAAGLTALFLKWRTLKRTFTTLSSKSINTEEFPLKWVGIGVALCSVALVIIQYLFFGLPAWLTLIAVILSAPLMLVGLRVLGETNWGPISQLTNMMQAIFAGLVPGNLTANLAASGTTGTIAVQSEAIMQDYKAGHIIGSTPKFLTYSQLIAAPIGAAAVALSYPLFKDLYGVGGDTGLASPISIRIVGFAEVLSKGFHSLPPGALEFMLIGAVVGIVITILESQTKWREYLPSPTGLGIGMMVPGTVVFTMVIGGLLYSAWRAIDKRNADRLGMPLASGLIAGEALVAILIPILVALGLLSA